MKVCMDVQAAIAQRAGVGRYVKELAEHFSPPAGDELSLFYFDFKRKGCGLQVPHSRQQCLRWAPGRLVQGAWKTLRWPPFNWLAGAADVYHFPNFVRPPLTRGRSVVTIHDVSFLRLPDTTEPRNLRYLEAQIHRTVEKADAIITDSVFSAREIEDLLQVPGEMIHPIHLGITSRPVAPNPSEIALACQMLKIQRPYLLMVGTIEPRKNIPFLVKVFEQLKDYEGTLVIAGMLGWKYEPILRALRESPRASAIQYLNFVDEALLPALYAGADAFIFPSLYEGFGFTPLEALSYGTPVVAAEAGSLPEVLGDAAVMVSGYELDRWVHAVNHVVHNAGNQLKLRELGRERVRHFSWDEAARKTWEVYREVARR